MNLRNISKYEKQHRITTCIDISVWEYQEYSLEASLRKYAAGFVVQSKIQHSEEWLELWFKNGYSLNGSVMRGDTLDEVFNAAMNECLQWIKENPELAGRRIGKIENKLRDIMFWIHDKYVWIRYAYWRRRNK